MTSLLLMIVTAQVSPLDVAGILDKIPAAESLYFLNDLSVLNDLNLQVARLSPIPPSLQVQGEIFWLKRAKKIVPHEPPGIIPPTDEQDDLIKLDLIGIAAGKKPIFVEHRPHEIEPPLDFLRYDHQEFHVRISDFPVENFMPSYFPRLRDYDRANKLASTGFYVLHAKSRN